MSKRFDIATFYSALDAQREARKLSWREVARATNVSASTLVRIGQGKLPDAENFTALVIWLGMDLKTFWKGESNGTPETLSVIATTLRNDPCLSEENATLIDGLVRSTYSKLSIKR
jgi:transcriptional regulator with XRE-family HTH domain